MRIILFLTRAIMLGLLSQGHAIAEPVGQFEIVTTRNASDVATTLSYIEAQDTPIGQTIAFTANGIKMKGLGCEQWQITEDDTDRVNLNDPLLADLNVEPTVSPISSGEQRILKSYSYACEGEQFLNVFQLDDRVIVIPWANSSQYLIAEMQLTTAQIKQFQKQLKSMKFYADDISGKLDEVTIKAIRSWVNYRLMNDNNATFYRPAITENLLDALGVLDIE